MAIDALAYPHIIDAVLAHADPGVLESFRLTSRHLRRVVDRLLGRRLAHIVLTSYSSYSASAADGDDHDSYALIATTPEGDYAGLRVPWSIGLGGEVPPLVEERCALVHSVDVRVGRAGYEAAGRVMAYMRPSVLCLAVGDTSPDTEGEGDQDDYEGGCADHDQLLDVRAPKVVVHWRLGTKCPFAIKTDTLVIIYDGHLPDSTSDGGSLSWLPSQMKAASLILDLSAFASPLPSPLSLSSDADLPESHAAPLLRALAAALALGTRLTLLSPSTLTSRIDGTGLPFGPPRSPPGSAGKRELPGHVLYALLSYLFGAIHSRLTIPGPAAHPHIAGMVNRQVSAALGRLEVMPREEWEGIEGVGPSC